MKEILYSLLEHFSSNIISNILALISLIFTIFIFYKAKKISDNFLISGIHRTPILGIEIYQQDKKVPIHKISDNPPTVEIQHLKRKPFLIRIPKKIFDFYNSMKYRDIRLKVLKIEDESEKQAYESLTPEEIFPDGEGIAEDTFSSDLLYIFTNAHMVMTESRMIEDNNHFYHVYINSFTIEQHQKEEIKFIPKGTYLFIFGIKSFSKNLKTNNIETEYLYINIK